MHSNSKNMEVVPMMLLP